MRVIRLLPVVAVVATVACGGADDDPATLRALADTSEKVAVSLAADEECEAATWADDLYDRARRAADDNAIDPDVADELVAVTATLTSRVTCPPPSPSPTDDGEHAEEEDKDEKGDEDKGEDDEGGEGEDDGGRESDGRGPDGRGPPGQGRG